MPTLFYLFLTFQANCSLTKFFIYSIRTLCTLFYATRVNFSEGKNKSNTNMQLLQIEIFVQRFKAIQSRRSNLERIFFFFTNWSQKVQSIPHCFLKGRKPWSRCNNTRCFVQQTIQPLISAFPFLSMLHTCFWRVSHETNFRDSCPRFFNIID